MISFRFNIFCSLLLHPKLPPYLLQVLGGGGVRNRNKIAKENHFIVGEVGSPIRYLHLKIFIEFRTGNPNFRWPSSLCEGYYDHGAMGPDEHQTLPNYSFQEVFNQSLFFC